MTIDSKTELKMPGTGGPAVTAQAAGAAGGAMPASSEAPPPVAPMSSHSRAEDSEVSAHSAGGNGAAQASTAASPASPVASPAAAPGAGGAGAGAARAGPASVEDDRAAKPPWEDIDLGPPPQWEELISAWRYLPTPPDPALDLEFGRLYDAYEIVNPSYVRRFLYHNRDLLAALFVILPQILARPEVEAAQLHLRIDPEGDGDALCVRLKLSVTGTRSKSASLDRLRTEVAYPVLGGYDERICFTRFWYKCR